MVITRYSDQQRSKSRQRFFLKTLCDSKGGSYGNKILYKNLKFFDKNLDVEDFVTLLMGKKSCLWENLMFGHNFGILVCSSMRGRYKILIIAEGWKWQRIFS